MIDILIVMGTFLGVLKLMNYLIRSSTARKIHISLELLGWAVVIVCASISLTHLGFVFETILPADPGWALLVSVVMILFGYGLAFPKPLRKDNPEAGGIILLIAGYLAAAVTYANYLDTYDWSIQDNISLAICYLIGNFLMMILARFLSEGDDPIVDILLLVGGSAALLGFGASFHKFLERIWHPGLLGDYVMTFVSVLLVAVAAGLSILIVVGKEDTADIFP